MAKKERPSPSEASEGGGFDMTPMIDVTFLLIIFFMCVTEMADASKAKLTLPQTVVGEQDVRPDPNRVIVNIQEDGKVVVNQNDYDDEKLQVLFKNVFASTRNQENVSSTPVVMRVDKAAEYRHVQKVMSIAMHQGLWKISFMSKDPMGKGSE